MRRHTMKYQESPAIRYHEKVGSLPHSLARDSRGYLSSRGLCCYVARALGT